MRAFSFRLQRLQRLAEGERRLRAQELAAAQADAAGARDEWADRRQARQAHLADAPDTAAPQPLDLDQWSAGQAAYQLLRGQELQAAQRAAAAERQADTARGAYLAARQQDRTLERVRARRHIAWLEAAERNAQAESDERNGRQGGPR